MSFPEPMPPYLKQFCYAPNTFPNIRTPAPSNLNNFRQENIDLDIVKN